VIVLPACLFIWPVILADVALAWVACHEILNRGYPAAQPDVSISIPAPDEGNTMTDLPKAWDSGVVRTWLDRRIEAARLDQAAADQRGYEAQDDYDKAAAEEWVCRALKSVAEKDDRAVFADRLKQLLAQDEYRVTGIYDDRRFERSVRAVIRKIAKMTKANEGFENTLRYQ
jgi:hypothetical protein